MPTKPTPSSLELEPSPGPLLPAEAAPKTASEWSQLGAYQVQVEQLRESNATGRKLVEALLESHKITRDGMVQVTEMFVKAMGHLAELSESLAAERLELAELKAQGEETSGAMQGLSETFGTLVQTVQAMAAAQASRPPS